MKTNTTLKIAAICVICAATMMSGCLNAEGDCQYAIDQALSDRDTEWQQRWNSNELMWKHTIKDRDAEWDRRWEQNNGDWVETLSNKDTEQKNAVRQAIRDRDAEYSIYTENRDAEWRKQLEDNDAQWRELIENRDAEWEDLVYQAIADRDEEWEYAIRQNSDQQTLDFIMQVLPLLLV